MQFTGELNSNWKGGRRYDGRYYLILNHDHPSVQHLQLKHRYVLEHRLVVEKKLGRYLTEDEQIHHINGNKLDNRIENLQVVTREEHNKLHKRVSDYLENGGDRKVFKNKRIKPS